MLFRSAHSHHRPCVPTTQVSSLQRGCTWMFRDIWGDSLPSKRKKKAHPLLLEQSCFKSRGRFPSAAYPLALFGSCLTSQTRYNGRGCGEHDVGEESVGEKTGLLAPFVLFRGQDEKRNTTPSRHGPDAIPSPRRPRTLEDSKQTRLGPEVSGGPRPPGCPEA